MIKISFDFDSTLSVKTIEDFAYSLINLGYEVWIVTSRFNDDPNKITNHHPSWMKAFERPGVNDDLRKVAKRIGIPSDRIIYTNMELKSDFFKNKDFLLHIDDDWVEINNINIKTNTKGISCFGNENWREQVKELLK